MKRQLLAGGVIALAALSGCASHQATPHAPTMAQRVTAWYAGPGGNNFQTVRADIDVLALDADNNDVTGVEADAGQLTYDATLAASTPPPVTPDLYSRAMTDYAHAGQLASGGDFTDSAADLAAGTALIRQVTDALPAFAQE